MEQLTKPELLNGEKVGNYQLTAQDIKDIHEALVVYMRNVKNADETTAKRIELLRQKVKEFHRVMNPS